MELSGGGVNTMTYDGDGKRRRTEDSDGLHFEGGRRGAPALRTYDRRNRAATLEAHATRVLTHRARVREGYVQDKV